jgi:hypothetical protein
MHEYKFSTARDYFHFQKCLLHIHWPARTPVLVVKNVARGNQ